MKIDWKYPQPRKGFTGAFDKFIGPGATAAEQLLQLFIPLIAMLSALLYAATLPVEWTVWQYAVCALLALDITGGIVTNATSSAKRWYHREGQTFKSHFGFILVHLLHLLLVSWLYLSLDILWLVYAGGYLLFAATIILAAPIYLQRPLALSLYGLSLMLSLYHLQAPLALEWFLPLFYLKLLVSHLPREEPYRP